MKIPTSGAVAPAADAARSIGLVDVADERRRTRGVQYTRHLNAAGSALLSMAVVDTVIEHLKREERAGGYESAAAARPQVEAVYDGAAAMLGCRREEIALLDSASTGLRIVVDALRLGSAHRLLASRSTYVSHAMHLMSLAQQAGVELVVLQSGADGAVDLDALRGELANGRGERDIVCVAHVPTSSGLVEPIEAIGALTREHGALYLLDATQTVGQLRVDVEAIGCDALATTGRKFLRAPRGTGLIYVRQQLLQRLAPTAPDVRGAEWTAPHNWQLAESARRFESFECSTAARLGLGVAIDELLTRGIAATAEHLTATAARLRAGLSDIEGVSIQDPAASPSAIVTFTVADVEPTQVKARLAEARINVVAVPASHGQWDLGLRDLDAVVRASVHVYNDEDEIASLLDVVETVAREARPRPRIARVQGGRG